MENEVKGQKEMKSTKGTKGLKAFLTGALLIGAAAVGLQAEASPDTSKPVLVVGEVGMQDKDFFVEEADMRYGMEPEHYSVDHMDLALGDSKMVIGDINGDRASHSIEAELASLAGEPIVVRGFLDTENRNEVHVTSINGIDYSNLDLARGGERESDR